MTVDYLFRPNMSISGWVGPEYTSTKTIVPIPLPSQILYVTVYDSSMEHSRRRQLRMAGSARSRFRLASAGK